MNLAAFSKALRNNGDESSLSARVHYHIFWPGLARLDWEVCVTHSEAEMRAKELAQPEERYSIAEFDHTCPECGRLAAAAFGGSLAKAEFAQTYSPGR